MTALPVGTPNPRAALVDGRWGWECGGCAHWSSTALDCGDANDSAREHLELAHGGAA